MYIYQLDYFGYNEGVMTPPIVLEHSKEFSDKEIHTMLEKIGEEFRYADTDIVKKELCDKFGFKVKEAKEINMSYFFW